MPKVYIIRAILDAEEDVIRDLAIEGHNNLYDLHELIVKAFDLDEGEMSSFFKSNTEWDQGEEISMMDFDPDKGMNALQQLKVSEAFTEEGTRMLFAYDYLNLWTFYLEAMQVKEAENGKQYPHVIAGVGDRPEQAPHRDMQSEGPDDDLFDLDDETDYDAEADEDDLWY